MRDNGNGSYSFSYKLLSAGEHKLFAMVNGCYLHEAGHAVVAEYGHLAAAECRAYLSGSGGKAEPSIAYGTSQAIIIEVGSRPFLCFRIPNP